MTRAICGAVPRGRGFVAVDKGNRTVRQAWVVAVLASMLVVPACGSDDAGELVGVSWRWTQLAGGDPSSDVPDPESYTIEFGEDGTFEAKADCNQVGGAYETDGDAITISPGPTTLVACGEDSLGDRFVAMLGAARSYAVGGDELTLTLAHDAGEMRLEAS